MKLNAGCGHRRLYGWLNVDAWVGCAPDLVWDLEQTPWPWADDAFEAVLFNHSLEHMGASSAVFLAMVGELYRVCGDGAEIQINVPHPRHDNFLGDPTHVRPLLPQTLSLFDARLNDGWAAEGAANTPLAHHLSVDFELVRAVHVLDERHRARLEAGAATSAEVQELLRSQFNVCAEIQMTLKTHKPSRAKR